MKNKGKAFMAEKKTFVFFLFLFQKSPGPYNPLQNGTAEQIKGSLNGWT